MLLNYFSEISACVIFYLSNLYLHISTFDSDESTLFLISDFRVEVLMSSVLLYAQIIEGERIDILFNKSTIVYPKDINRRQYSGNPSREKNSLQLKEV